MTNLEYKIIMALIDTCVDAKVITGDTYHHSCNVTKLKAAIESIYKEEIKEEE